VSVFSTRTASLGRRASQPTRSTPCPRGPPVRGALHLAEPDPPGADIDVTLDVRNGGGSPFVLDPASSRITVSDGTDVMTGLASGSAITLAPSASATLNLSFTLGAGRHGEPALPRGFGAPGNRMGPGRDRRGHLSDSEIVVLTPLAAIQARGIDTSAPVQVARGGAPVRVWGVELTPLAATGSATGDSLRSVAVTVLTDGSAGAAPGGAVSSIALRDRNGALLAQSAPAPGRPNPVTLVLSPPVALGSAPESLFLEVSFRAGTEAQRVAFRLAQPGDVVAVDVFTGAQVPLVGGGGLPFAALTSPDITFLRSGATAIPIRSMRETRRSSSPTCSPRTRP